MTMAKRLYSKSPTDGVDAEMHLPEREMMASLKRDGSVLSIYANQLHALRTMVVTDLYHQPIYDGHMKHFKDIR